MTLATRRVTFSEYLTYDDGLGTRYELVNGELIPMSLGSGEHGDIIRCLVRQLEGEVRQLGQDWVVVPALVGVQSPRGDRWDTARIPDLTVLPKAQWKSLKKREAVIQLNEPSPLLVVEVVSESTKSADYGAKRTEYRLLGISEYWIVDPLLMRVTLCQLGADTYQETVFVGDDRLVSPTFPGLNLSATDILDPDD